MTESNGAAEYSRPLTIPGKRSEAEAALRQWAGVLVTMKLQTVYGVEVTRDEADRALWVVCLSRQDDKALP